MFPAMGEIHTGVRVVGVRAFGDEVLAAIAPLGLALAAEQAAVVVDADPLAPPYPGGRTVAAVAEEGPSRSELRPDGRGVAILPNGGAGPEEVAAVVTLLSEGWPAVVVRVGASDPGIPVIPLRPLWPGFLAPAGSRAAVWRRVGTSTEPPGPGPVLPPPGRGTVTALLGGRRPVRSRWVRAWRRVWEMPWG